MGFLTRIFQERRAHPSQPEEWLIKLLGGSEEVATGQTVTPEGSLASIPVFGAVRILAESVASLPLPLYRRLPNGGKERATDHPLYPILHDLPNPEMTSYYLRETLMGHLGLWGNAFAEIELNRAGQVRGLWPLRPDLVVVKRINRRLFYDVLMPTGPNVRLPWERVMHIPAFGTDGVVGYSPIAMARQAVGLAMGTEEFGARFFGNGARPGVVLEHPGHLSDEAQVRLRKSIETRHQGLSNAHRLMILEEGMGLKEVGIPPEDAQFLETRKFQVAEIARLYRIPPHMLADLERATFSNIEQQSLEFVIFTLQPWLVRWEQTIGRDLLTQAERQTYLAEHLVAGLLRGDTQSRYEAYSIGRQNGWLSANDVRRLENMNPIPGGDDYLAPLNMQSMGAEAQAEDEDQERAVRGGEQRMLEIVERRAARTAQERSQLAATYQEIIFDSASRVIRREVNDVRRAIKRFFGQRNAQEFSLWLTEFYEAHQEFWQQQLRPILLAYANLVAQAVGRELELDEASSAEAIIQFIDDYLAGLGTRQIGESIGQLRALLDEALLAGEPPEDRLNERLDAWEDSRAERLAHDESNQAGNAFARQFYLLAGVIRLRWVNRGSENCPYCRALDGAIVGIQELFLTKDTDFQPDGADRPLNRRTNVGHPPLHKGCDCQVVADRR